MVNLRGNLEPRAMSNIPRPYKYAYFVVNDSDNLEALQNSLAPYGGVEAMDDVVVDYAMDKRRAAELIRTCGERGIIYTPYLARLGKSLKELYSIVKYANERNVEIVFCDKPQVTFNSKLPNGCIYLSSLQWAVELQENIKSENTNSGLSRKKDEISRLGSSRNKAGEIITRLGRPSVGVDNRGNEIYDVSAMVASASQKRTEAMIKWRESSMAVKYTLRKWEEGWSVTQIAEELGKLFDDAPDIYCTPKGAKPTKGTVSKWLKEAKERQSSTDDK